jgi:Raf kinase inhibitor-like YbhB/YbcL family protein
MVLVLTSPAFVNHGAIPKRFTCEGADISPPLQWEGAPRRTQSFALIVDDPDAPDPRKPQRTWVHWVVYNIPAGTSSLVEDAARQGWPEGARQGLNDWHRPGFGGPCPPIGRHRYFHRLFALDTVLPDLGANPKPELVRAMAGHVLAEAELIGTYQKGS